MKKMVQVTKEQISCDGCDYLMSLKDPHIIVSVPFDYPLEFLQDNRIVTFEFHALHHRHDCFRYWAHNPEIMRRSLRERDFTEEQIEDFMELMLYRQTPYSPGIERPKAKV